MGEALVVDEMFVDEKGERIDILEFFKSGKFTEPEKNALI